MQINHNVRAMVTQHALFQNNGAMSKSLEKLSTGLRINRAQDDAAGLAMSEQMRGQIRGLGKAKQNAQDGQAALQIAEGGLAEITNMVQRQRELAVQAANDTLTSTERKYLEDERAALDNEIIRVAQATEYNTKKMLWNKDTAAAYFGNGSTLHVGPNSTTSVDEIKVTYSFGSMFTQINANVATTQTYGGTTRLYHPNSTDKTDQNDAVKAIAKAESYLKSISGIRASIGTYINRLEYTVNNIANMEFNTQDAESRIRDTNFASETTNFTRNQIMVQSATSMLAQANSLPQSVLGLIG